jgi:hypothetical protein
VSDDSRNIYFFLGEFDFLPHAPLMLMARIGRFDGISAGTNLSN